MGRIDVTKLPPVGSLVTEADLRHLRWILGITSDVDRHDGVQANIDDALS